MIGSVSKILSPGLRLAVIHVPKRYFTEVSSTLYSIVITPPALMMQLFTRIVNLGKFDKIRELRIKELIERNKLFDKICSEFESIGNSNCPLRWAFIPDEKNITPSTVEKELFGKGIQVYSAERFVVGNSDIPQAIRISLISEHDTDLYIMGLKKIRDYFRSL